MFTVHQVTLLRAFLASMDIDCHVEYFGENLELAYIELHDGKTIQNFSELVDFVGNFTAE